MKLRIFLRTILTIVFGLIGAFIGNNVTLFAILGDFYLVASVLIFGLLGFILPEIVELLGKAGVAALATYLMDRLPTPSGTARAFSRKKRKNNKNSDLAVVDTSSLIDGRIIDVVKTGFLTGTFIILPSVISELQKLADGANDQKRVRGRRGLDNLHELQALKLIKVHILKQEPVDHEVDSKLVSFAKQQKAKLLTVDFNLIKVAKVQGIIVLNVNELASAVRVPVLSGEQFNLLVTTKGSGKNQGVGYLDDGTMVVVENGSYLVGKSVEVEVTRVLQTAAGKMVFSKVAE